MNKSKIWIAGYGKCLIVFLINVLEGNLQWNSWIFKMIEHLKGSIVKVKFNFEKTLENKQYDDNKYQVKHWCV